VVVVEFMLLNNNIKVNEEIFHIQTEKISRNNIMFSHSQIFLNGAVIWSNRKVITSKVDEEIKQVLKDSHKEAIIFLRDVSVSSKKIDFIQLKNIISDLKDNGGVGIISIDVFIKNTATSIGSYNSNKYASTLFSNIYSSLTNQNSDIHYSINLDYYFLSIDNNKFAIVGKIKNTNFMYGILCDLNEVKLGLLLNVLIPDFLLKIYNLYK